MKSNWCAFSSNNKLDYSTCENIINISSYPKVIFYNNNKSVKSGHFLESKSILKSPSYNEIICSSSITQVSEQKR